MEYSNSIIDPQDELRRLQDKIRRLEIQNEQLRSQTSNRNGLVEKLGCDIVGKGDTAELDVLNKSSSSLDVCQLIEVATEDLADPETWLIRPLTRQGKDTYLDYQTLLHQDINSNSNEFQVMRRAILQRIEDSKQVSPRTVDTRTFTRPKKRISRPPLETMLEVPILENRQLMSSPWFSKKNMHALGDNIEDVSMMLESTLSSLTSEPENANQTFCKTDFASINSSRHISGTQGNETKDNAGFHLNTENLLYNTTFQRQSSAGQANQWKSKEQGNINATLLVTQTPTFLNTTACLDQDCTLKNSVLNSTFTMGDGEGSSGSQRSGRTASCESGLDEDQLSSASDSSYSSANKPMNVGDVQIIADIQEESLKQTNSTPVRGFRDVSFSNLGEDLPSPIVPDNCPDVHHGYQSDHSDHSSADSRAKSSRSSVQSSCSSSPCGSTNLLSNENDNAPYQHPVGLPSKEWKAAPSARQPAVQKSTAPVIQQPEGVRSRPSSGLRPPSIRPPRINAGQPQGRPTSGIPRLPSRLPAPRLRLSVAGQPPNKTNGMRGHY